MIIKYVPSGYESKYKGTEVDEAVGRASSAASLTENNVFEGDNEFKGVLILGDKATATTPETSDNSDKVATTAYVKEQGYITGIVKEDVIEALGYTPYDSNNPDGYISEIDSEMIIDALEYTPENISNKVTSIAASSTDEEYPSAKCVYTVTNENAQAIATNTADIATNRNNIATNTADITTNRNNIATNTADITTNRNNITTNTSDIATINSKIPSVATPENQLADKAFVNSSIATSTATFRGTYNSLEDLETYSGPKDDNDYAFVISTDSAGNTLYNRYKYNGTEWLFEYALNNSSFTAVQWEAINSGANTTNIAQIATNTSDISSLQNNKQDNITDLQTIREGAQAGSTALQPNDNISELTNNVGYITGISSSDVINALGYTPYNSTNPAGYISGINSSDVVAALGYTPYDNANPAGYISGITSSDVTTALGYTPYDSTNPNGFITGISSSDVVSALGYTPYNSTNPAGYISSASVNTLTDVTLSSVSNGQALLYNSTSGKWENANIVTSISWGGITGTLSDQADLQNALNEKTTMAAVEAKGYITGITSSMISTALGYTPYDGDTNPNGYIVGISSSDVVSALGYTPEDTNNKVTSISASSTDTQYPSAKCVYDAIQASGGDSLATLSDVSITNPAQGENLTYDAVTGKWQNTSSSATVGWGGITGTLSDQTDLQDALDQKASRFSATNPTLISTNDTCTWTITNTIGSKKVQVTVYEVYTYKEVLANVSATDSDITVEFISNADIGADTYEAVVVG